MLLGRGDPVSWIFGVVLFQRHFLIPINPQLNWKFLYFIFQTVSSMDNSYVHIFVSLSV